jgi:hypothetical protein
MGHVSTEHRRPLIAFILVALLCALAIRHALVTEGLDGVVIWLLPR